MVEPKDQDVFGREEFRLFLSLYPDAMQFDYDQCMRIVVPHPVEANRFTRFDTAEVEDEIVMQAVWVARNEFGVLLYGNPQIQINICGSGVTEVLRTGIPPWIHEELRRASEGSEWSPKDDTTQVLIFHYSGEGDLSGPLFAEL